MTSTLIAIDPDTAVATPIGSSLGGVEIRGAVFDLSDRLLAIDAWNYSLLEINPTNSQILSTVALTGGPETSDSRYAYLDTSDIAVRADGTLYLSWLDTIYTLDPSTGALTFQYRDYDLYAKAFAGLSFSIGAGIDDLFAYEINYSDDIYLFDVGNNFSKNTVHLGIIPAYNAGRGDLASVAPVPEPATMLLLGSGLVGLAGLRRRLKKA